MKKIGIIIILIFCLILINNISAEESINLEYIDPVEPMQEFDLIINFNDFPKSSYDLKIEIKEGNTNIAEKYWEGEWKSTYYWIYDAIDTNNAESLIISMRIEDGYIGDYEIIVKIKDGIEREFSGNFITVREIIEEEVDEEEESNGDEPYFEISWDEDEIINGEEFEILVKGYDLEDRDYNLKLWIEKEDENVVISDRYDESEESWKSGRYYLNEIISGPGDKEETIKLRIKSSYSDYNDYATIFLKSNDNDIEVVEEDIIILELNEEEDEEDEIIEEEVDGEEEIEEVVTVSKTKAVSGNIIRLNSVKEDKENNDDESEDKVSEEILDKENTEIIYESDNEIIKKYSVYGFTILLAFFVILLIFNKL